MRRQLDAIAQLCRDDGEETRITLLGLQNGTRRFVAALCAPGSIASTPPQWALDQRALHDAAEAFVAVLLSFTHKFHSAETVPQLAALRPKALLEGPFAALEAVYPQVSERHKRDVERLARSVAVKASIRARQTMEGGHAIRPRPVWQQTTMPAALCGTCSQA